MLVMCLSWARAIWESPCGRAVTCRFIPFHPCSARATTLFHPVGPKPVPKLPVIPVERFYGQPPRPRSPPPFQPDPPAEYPRSSPRPAVKIPVVMSPTIITREQRQTIKAVKVAISRAISRHLCSRAAAKHSSMMFATVKVDNINAFTARCVLLLQRSSCTVCECMAVLVTGISSVDGSKRSRIPGAWSGEHQLSSN